MSSDRFNPRPAGIPADDIDVPASLSGRVERTVLRAEVAALKSELERKEHNHGLVIEQYEQLLEARCQETDDRQQGSSTVDRLQGRGNGSVTSALRDHVSDILQP